MDIKDQCGNKPGYDLIVGMYVGFLQYGVNYTNKDGLRVTTVAGYAKAVNTLFTLRGFTSPVELSDPDNLAGIKIINQQKYPALNCCTFFQIEPRLILLIWDIVLNERWPCHKETKSLLRKPLGKLITSYGQT